MIQVPTPELRCSVNVSLIGALSYEELSALHRISLAELQNNGWRIDWYEAIDELVQSKQTLDFIPPNQFYRKTYQVTDLGLLHVGNFKNSTLIRKCSTHVRESICPNFQMHTTYVKAYPLSSDTNSLIWADVRACVGLLNSLLIEAGLRATHETITICFECESGPNDPINALAKNLSRHGGLLVIGDESIEIISASMLEGSLVVRTADADRERVLVFSLNRESRLGLDRLYYLMIAKRRIKELIAHLETIYVADLQSIQEEIARLRFTGQVRNSDVEKLLELRNRIAERSGKYKRVRSHVDLTTSFLNLHVAPLFSANEVVVFEGLPGFAKYENDHLVTFYTNSLQTMVEGTNKLIDENLAFLTTLTEIFLIKVNLHSQVIIERLQLIAVIVALLALVPAIITLLQ